MQTYQFKEFVNNEGVVTLSGLPPSTQVVIMVMQPDLSDWQDRLDKLIKDVSENHLFAKMNKKDILEHLRQMREEVQRELYGDKHLLMPYQDTSSLNKPGQLADTLVFEEDIVSPLGEDMWEVDR